MTPEPSEPTVGDGVAEVTPGFPGDGDAVEESASVDDGPPEPPDGQPETPAGGGGRRSRRWILEWAIVLVVAVLVAVLVRTYVVQTFYIPSGSMEPTLQIGDRIIVDKLSYDLHAVHRGDIVVFRRPPHEDCDPGEPPVNDLVKRVIGLPGDTISARNGKVYINGKVLAEPWLPREYAYTAPFGPLKIPRGDYFVMGDHRDDSCDSRVWGPLPGSYIVGRVVMRIWPLSRIGFL